MWTSGRHGVPSPMHGDLAGGVRPADQVVQHEVAAQLRRDAVGGRVAQVDRGEAGVGELREVLLGSGPSTRRRPSAGRTGCCSVTSSPPPAAPYTLQDEEKTKRSTPAALRELGDPQRAADVDVASSSRGRAGRSGRSTGAARCTTASKPSSSRRRDVADVAADRRQVRLTAVGAEEPGVEADHVVTGLGQDAGRDRADVAGVAGEQDAHGLGDLHMVYDVVSARSGKSLSTALKQCSVSNRFQGHALHRHPDPRRPPDRARAARRRARLLRPRLLHRRAAPSTASSATSPRRTTRSASRRARCAACTTSSRRRPRSRSCAASAARCGTSCSTSGPARRPSASGSAPSSAPRTGARCTRRRASPTAS